MAVRGVNDIAPNNVAPNSSLSADREINPALGNSFRSLENDAAMRAGDGLQLSLLLTQRSAALRTNERAEGIARF